LVSLTSAVPDITPMEAIPTILRNLLLVLLLFNADIINSLNK
jgi:hypothetical protein